MEITGTLLATISNSRRDDASSGYSSITEQLSVQQEVNEGADDDDEDNNLSDSDGSQSQVYAAV